MKAKSISMLALVALVLSNAPAFADWQYTKWGMTPDDVSEASEGTAVLPDTAIELVGSNPPVHLLTAPYALADGSLQFQAHFFFHDSQSLEMVLLEPFVQDCVTVYRRLEETYGHGIRHRDQIISSAKWFDRENGNVVFFAEISDTSCSLRYRRFATPGEAGGL